MALLYTFVNPLMFGLTEDKWTLLFPFVLNLLQNVVLVEIIKKIWPHTDI